MLVVISTNEINDSSFNGTVMDELAKARHHNHLQSNVLQCAFRFPATRAKSLSNIIYITESKKADNQISKGRHDSRTFL
ncbi:hypothetical protein QCF01_18010, partial [Staphylococcus aureus]|nr:hypothetical protein [Staphylococcus aureus]